MKEEKRNCGLECCWHRLNPEHETCCWCSKIRLMADKAKDETDAELLAWEPVNSYIRDLLRNWTTGTEDEKTLVAGNLRAFWGHCLEKLRSAI